MRATAIQEPAELLPHVLERSVRDYGARPAMEFLGRVWSYRGLGRLVDAAAKGLQDLGVAPGVKVGLCLPNTPYSVILYYAVLKVGGVVVNYNPLYTPRELEHQIRDSGTSVMAVADMPEFVDKVTAVAKSTGLVGKIILCSLAEAMGPAKGFLYRLARRKDIAPLPPGGMHVSFRQLIAARGRPTPVAIAASDLGVLQYTGGTTGVPKGVMLTQGNLAANAVQTLTVMDHMQHGQERLVAVLPLFHVFAMTSVMNCSILSASEILLLPRFDLQGLLKLIHTRRATIMHAVPTLFGAINSAAGSHAADLSSIKYCISGGAPLPAEIAERFRELTGAVLVEGYGLSETSPVLTCNPVSTGGKPGSVGLPLPSTIIEIRDLQDPHRLVGPGERGEVCARGPQVMAGYWQRPEDTAEVFIDGALRTGDVGYLDEDGYLFLVDRIKDMIIASGFKVYPRMIEEALYRHPAVREAIVVGVPDEYRGQAPLAYVSLQPGAEATADSLKAFLADHVSKIEMPKEIRIRDELPKTAVGKPSKKDLIQQEGLATGSTAASSPAGAA
jgi:long-chain acyl-CoA synthetase